MTGEYVLSGNRVNYYRCLTGYKQGCTVQPMTTLGDRLKQARRKARLTQQQLEARSGVSQQMISKLERGGSDETAGIVRLAMALGVSPEWLEFGEEGRTFTGTGIQATDPAPLTGDELEAIRHVRNLTPTQRAEWFKSAKAYEKLNREVREHFGLKDN